MSVVITGYDHLMITTHFARKWVVVITPPFLKGSVMITTHGWK